MRALFALLISGVLVFESQVSAFGWTVSETSMVTYIGGGASYGEDAASVPVAGISTVIDARIATFGQADEIFSRVELSSHGTLWIIHELSGTDTPKYYSWSGEGSDLGYDWAHIYHNWTTDGQHQGYNFLKLIGNSKFAAFHEQ